jgi:hypothetical protein
MRDLTTPKPKPQYESWLKRLTLAIS